MHISALLSVYYIYFESVKEVYVVKAKQKRKMLDSKKVNSLYKIIQIKLRILRFADVF